MKKCQWCFKETKTSPCQYCGHTFVVDSSKPHSPDWSRYTIDTVECKICGRKKSFAEYSIKSNDECPGKSEREMIQDKLVSFLEERGDKFDAPYGVISGLSTAQNGKGKYRTITFGVARLLDATIRIFTPKKICIEGQGGLAYKYEGTFSSANEVIQKLSE